MRWVLIVLPLSLVVGLVRWLQRRPPADADYVQAIQGLKPDRPLDLPPVKPLRARRDS